ncbi:hypothetical protein GQ43DRAFT_85872 [Delitschia confertaspora ATCC 74209]|uniref:BTB domain-containing protein n=1 Tax=Delitschia confertaspora ATCC 74209 TaxID=1513339 RepID=A0A9P4JT02_9PLEO|nr:hypothetical protein GQ43DRAFT_85872 [Delitschia confertaspora ATCC 74209]
MASLPFLPRCAEVSSGATLLVLLPDGSIDRIRFLNPEDIGDRCPIFAASFEHSHCSGQLQASLSVSSVDVAVCFLRFIYLRSYIVYDDFGKRDPCSLLTHSELYKLGEIYEMPQLQVAAHLHVMEETEMSCSKPEPPVGLCTAIRFLYQYPIEGNPILETILNYCVHSFRYHKLGTNEEFCQTASDVPQFHGDLCRTSLKRGFEDEGAADIVRFRFSAPKPLSEPPPDTSKASSEKRDFALVHRPKDLTDLEKRSDSESSSDDGFTLVHRPKSRAAIIPTEVPTENDSATTEYATVSTENGTATTEHDTATTASGSDAFNIFAAMAEAGYSYVPTAIDYELKLRYPTDYPIKKFGRYSHWMAGRPDLDPMLDTAESEGGNCDDKDHDKRSEPAVQQQDNDEYPSEGEEWTLV